MPVTDNFTKASAGTRPIATTLSASRAIGATTITCTELSGWPADGEAVHFIIYTLDVNGKKVNGSQVDCKGVRSTNTITNIQYKAGTDNGNAIGAVVQASPTAAWADDLVDGLRNEHNSDGTHENITATTIATSGRVTAGNGLTVSAGTVVLPPASIGKDELEKPHYAKAFYSTGGTLGGQVVTTTEVAASFDALDANSVGITLTTGRLKIARTGMYSITVAVWQSDGALSKVYVWTWLNTNAADQTDIATRKRFRHVERDTYNGAGNTYEVKMWLEAGWWVGADWYASSQIRLASSGETLLDRSNFGPYIAIQEIR